MLNELTISIGPSADRLTEKLQEGVADINGEPNKEAKGERSKEGDGGEGSGAPHVIQAGDGSTKPEDLGPGTIGDGSRAAPSNSCDQLVDERPDQ